MNSIWLNNATQSIVIEIWIAVIQSIIIANEDVKCQLLKSNEIFGISMFNLMLFQAWVVDTDNGYKMVLIIKYTIWNWIYA